MVPRFGALCCCQPGLRELTSSPLTLGKVGTPFFPVLGTVTILFETLLLLAKILLMPKILINSLQNHDLRRPRRARPRLQSRLLTSLQRTPGWSSSSRCLGKIDSLSRRRSSCRALGCGICVSMRTVRRFFEILASDSSILAI